MMHRALVGFALLVIGCASHPKHGSSSPADAPGSAHDAAGLDASLGTDAQLTEAGITATGDAASSNAADAGATRHFRLATTGAQLVVSGPALGFQLTAGNVIEDSDVVSVHQEFYGVPWDSFEANTAPPAEWASLMASLASAAKTAKKPVFLSISMLNGKRESLAAKTTIMQGQVKSQDDWSTRCYDFASAPDAASKRTAYLRYVAYMVEHFAPAYLNVAIEVNLFLEKCPAAAAGLVELINTVYAAVKKQAPATLVFPSIQIDHLYGYASDSCVDQTKRDACFDTNYAAVAGIKRDRFAMSSYPYMANFKSAAELPADWFKRGAARGGEIPLIAETGWPSTPIVVRAKDGKCLPYFSFDEATSAAYLARVLGDAKTQGLALVTWWSDRDLVVDKLMTDCPCSFDATWCSVLDIFRGPATAGTTDTQLLGELLLKVFGTMGIRHYDGTPKPMHYAQWTAARKLPYAP